MDNPRFSLASLWVIATVLLCVVALTHNMSGYSLFDPDEGRNAEIAREMATTGDYILPHLNGLPYLDKPSLYFAVGAVSQRILGSDELAARLPSLLFTFATIALVAWFAKGIFGRGAAVTAAVATSTMPFTLAYSRIVIFDSTLTFFVVLSLVAFYFAVEERIDLGGLQQRWTTEQKRLDEPDAGQPDSQSAQKHGKGSGWTSLAWVAIGFGVLTKGPIAVVLPLLVAIPFALRYRAARSIADPVSLLLFSAIVTPWLIAVSLRIPDFLKYALVTETAMRFSTSELGRTGPIWYFLVILPAATLPWSLVLAGAGMDAVRNSRPKWVVDRRVFFLLLWIAAPLVFFTISQSKRPQYVLPIVPAVALLVAAVWNRQSGRLPGARWGSLGLVLLGVFFVGASGKIAELVPANTDIAAAIPFTAVALGLVCACAGIVAWFSWRIRDMVLLAFGLPVAVIPFASHNLLREIGNDRSAELLATAITDAAGDSVRIVGIGTYPPSLPFYLRRTIIVATADGSELTSNYLTRHIREYRGFGSTLRRADWWQEALISCTEPTVFIASTHDGDVRDALSHLDLIATTRKHVAFGPCGGETLARMER